LDELQAAEFTVDADDDCAKISFVIYFSRFSYTIYSINIINALVNVHNLPQTSKASQPPKAGILFGSEKKVNHVAVVD
jgi:hypothetical protein